VTPRLADSLESAGMGERRSHIHEGDHSPLPAAIVQSHEQVTPVRMAEQAEADLMGG
jgi:hypothetical protein